MKLNRWICFCVSSFFILNFSYGKEYQVAFYSDFEPISYSKNKDPSSKEFNEAQGYEPDLLHAIETISSSDMTFTFHAVKQWNNIWLAAATNPQIDIAIGGITKEEKRLLDSEGKPVVEGTHKTVNFKQSLLMRKKGSEAVNNHEDLTCAFIVGAVRGTTGEYRFLAQADLIDSIDKGNLKKGITVVLADKSFLTSDGSLSIYDEKVKHRVMLLPPDCSLPLTKYFVAEDSMIPALEEGYIDAIARGYIGNKLIADRSHNEFIVKSIYSLECPRQESVTCSKKEEAVFFIKKGNQDLLTKLNTYIDYLTDNGKIGYEEWSANKNIFLERAKTFKK